MDLTRVTRMSTFTPSQPQIDRRVYQEYPAVVRDAYANVLSDREPSGRHRRLCSLAEVAIAYFASLAFSDYRSHHYRDPDMRVEASVAKLKRISRWAVLGAV